MICPSEPSSRKPVVKVCGIIRQSDLDACCSMGVQYCGFIFHPGSARYIAPERAGMLRSTGLKRVGVFVRHNAQEIIGIMKEARLDFAQLHGDQSVECSRTIGAHRVIRVLWPKRYDSIEGLLLDMEQYADSCCMFLLDGGLEGGGSGSKVDWKQLKGMDTPRPWLLAGGLSSDSLPQALANCSPNGVDLNSGVEWAPGYKSAQSLLSAMRAIREQTAKLNS